MQRKVELIVDGSLIKKRQDLGEEGIWKAVQINQSEADPLSSRGEQTVCGFVVCRGQADLFQVVLALSPASRFAGLLHSGKQQGD